MNTFRLNIKPLSVNSAWKGRRFKTKEYTQYEKDISLLLNGVPPVASRHVSVEYVFHLVNHARTDIDNLIKTLQDIIVKKGIIEDDRYIYRVTAVKLPSKVDFIEVTIVDTSGTKK